MKFQIVAAFLLAPLLIAEDAPRQKIPLWQQMQTAVLVHKDTAEVRRILDAGFHPNGGIGCGDWAPIRGAVQNHDLNMAKLLLERGATVPDAVMEQVCGTYDRDLAFPKLLIAYGGNVNAGDKYSTCLHSAVWHKNDEMVRLLLASKVDLNAICQDGGLDGTPLMWALQIGATEIAQLLLDAGTDLAAKGKSGITAKEIIEGRLAMYQKLQAQILHSPAN